MDSVWQSGKLHSAYSASTLLYILKKSQLLCILSRYFPIWCSCPLDSASTNSENDENRGLGAQAGQFRRNCSISVLSSLLARSSGVWPQLAINWKQLCLTLNHSPNGTSWISNGKQHIYVSGFRQHPLDQARMNLGNNISWSKVGVKPAIWPNISWKSNPFCKKTTSILFSI